MKVEKWDFIEQPDTVEVSAVVDGFRLWYRLPKSYPVSRGGDPFLAAALLPAMLRGEELEIDPGLPVSPKLLKNLSELQEIHHCWNPIFKIIPISAKMLPARSLDTGAMSFFSGGVDSAYTFIKHEEEISHLVFIQGLDFYTNSAAATFFSIGDIADLAQLAYKLNSAGDSASSFVKSMLSESTLRALPNYRDSGSDAGILEKSLSKDLNRIISGPSIYEAKRFAGVRLREETRRLLAQARDGESQGILNRLLLEDCYPLEIARKDSSVYQTAVQRIAGFARSFGKTLIPVATNHYPFGYRYNLSRNLTQGSALASVALLLGFPRVYLPAAYSYNQLIPLGSHPLTDPLWSNEGVEIIHDGAAARRVDKVIKIAKHASALANLRVCFNDMNINCGECSKCLRTMIPLNLLHASAAPFPPLPPRERLRKMRIGGDIEMIFFRENIDLALQTGNEDLRDALKACIRRFDRKQLFKEFDRVILCGLIKRAYRGRGGDNPGIRRFDSSPPRD